MPAGNAHRILHTLFEAFMAPNGPGILPDPGNGGVIGPNMNLQICEMVTGGSGETRTLRNPSRPGVRLLLRLKTDGGGNSVVTAANGLNVTGNTVATFADAGDQLELVSVSHTSGYRWEILVNTGSVGLA